MRISCLSRSSYFWHSTCSPPLRPRRKPLWLCRRHCLVRKLLLTLSTRPTLHGNRTTRGEELAIHPHRTGLASRPGTDANETACHVGRSAHPGYSVAAQESPARFPMDGFHIEKLIFESLPGVYVTALVYVPDDEKKSHPAVLVRPATRPTGRLTIKHSVNIWSSADM